jgi:hypothetical protein
MDSKRDPKVEIFCVAFSFVAILVVIAVEIVMAPAALAQTNSSLFILPVTYSSEGLWASSVAAADLNGDGNPDLVVANCAPGGSSNCEGYGSVGVLLAKGDGTFQKIVTYPSGGCDTRSVTVADVNGDGAIDVVVASASDSNHCTQVVGPGTISVLLGNADGTLQPPVTYSSGGNAAWSLAVGDVNGDGKPDLIAVNQYDNSTVSTASNVAILLGNGDANFQPPVTHSLPSFAATSVAVADVNGDGRPDLLVSLSCESSSSCSGALAVLINKGAGTFQTARTYESGGTYADSVSVADVNRDGRPDLLTSNYGSDTAGVLLGNGDGTFQSAMTFGAGGGTNSGLTCVEAADVNGDGKPDLIAANYLFGTVGVLLGNGDGTFQPAVTYAANESYLSSIAVADLNRDRKPDLAVGGGYFNGSSGTGSVAVFLSNAPFCTAPPVITLSATPTSLWPPNGKMVPVTVTGAITHTGCTVRSAAYTVTDEYGEVQPSGPVTIGPQGTYSFTVLLQASRLGTDLDGRSYKVTVRASNNAGKTGSKMAKVVVPHDQGY